MKSNNREEFPLDYREVMRVGLKKIREQRPRYSIRAYSRDLQISHSQLSRVLNGKRNLSRDSAVRVSGSLGFTNGTARAFFLLVRMQSAKFHGHRNLAAQGLRSDFIREGYQNLEAFCGKLYLKT